VQNKKKKNSFPNFGQKSYERAHVNNYNSLIVRVFEERIYFVYQRYKCRERGSST